MLGIIVLVLRLFLTLWMGSREMYVPLGSIVPLKVTVPLHALLGRIGPMLEVRVFLTAHLVRLDSIAGSRD